jgi:spore germination protein GerM
VAARKPIRKNSKKENPKSSQAVIIFWLIFIIVIISVFMLNSEVIKRNFNLFKTRLTIPVGTEEVLPDEEEGDELEIVISEQPPAASERQATPSQVAVEPPQTTEPQRQADPQGSAEQPAQTQTQTQTQTTTPVQTRDRTVYFTQIDKDGQILQSRVTRRIPVSDSPMLDVLNAMFAGPSSDEINRGILNLIPQNTRILSATVRGNTAYISFSEDFLFNTFGVEGSVAQLRQIVWTVTEFQNVNDVQILVEGRRMDYLGEGIWIGSPISRQSF